MKKLIIASGAAILLVLTATLLITGCFGTFNPNPQKPSPTATPSPTPTPPPTLTVPDDFPTISAAIDNATNGYKIIIKDGTYVEQTLSINKSLTIVSEHQNGAQLILHPPPTYYYYLYAKISTYLNPIQINSDNVTLSGFLISNDGGTIAANGTGIQILNNDFLGKATIDLSLQGSENKIIGNSIGALTLGGNNNEVASNQIKGFTAVKGTLNAITKNIFPSLYLTGSNNTVSSNQAIGSGDVGISLLSGDYNIIWNNTEKGNNVGLAIGSNGDGGEYNFVGGNTVSNARLFAMLMCQGSYNVFYGNMVKDSVNGLAVGSAPAQNNFFFENSFINNIHNVQKTWKIAYPNSYDNGTVGNYWDDYIKLGVYVISGSNNNDHCPLDESPGVLTDIPVLPSPWSKISLALN